MARQVPAPRRFVKPTRSDYMPVKAACKDTTSMECPFMKFFFWLAVTRSRQLHGRAIRQKKAFMPSV